MAGIGNPQQTGSALSDATPLEESGAGAAGTGTSVSRADHVHPAAAAGAATDLSLGGDARGMIARREAATWEGYSAKASGQILVGDGTDIISAAMSGDAALSAAGALTIADPTKVYTATLALNNTNIVGSAAGDIGSAGGIDAIAAVAGKLIVIDLLSIEYTLVVQRYGAGGNVSADYLVGATLIPATTVIAAGNCFEAATSRMSLAAPINVYETASGGASGLVGAAVKLHSTAAFTDLGASAGTAVVTILYRVVDL